ncbi:MAG TPA: integrase arm-type DNA-binding domain-containing protein [Thermoanaerobaculia bacterium]|nr:integrase arm-type DNA-binding domain-containing protein [Thermoanaerobaculia bacterium]
MAKGPATSPETARAVRRSTIPIDSSTAKLRRFQVRGVGCGSRLDLPTPASQLGVDLVGAFVFRYSYGGKQRKIPLGTAVPKEPGVETTPGTVTLEDARRRAVGYWSQLEDGQDPGTVRAERRIVEPTVAEVAADFIAHMSMVDEKTGTTKRKSVIRMRQALDKYILPALGERRMNDLSQGDAHRLHTSITRSGIYKPS